jgi:hypothetical protein
MDQDFLWFVRKRAVTAGESAASLTEEPANNNADKQQQNKRLLGIVRNMI